MKILGYILFGLIMFGLISCSNQEIRSKIKNLTNIKKSVNEESCIKQVNNKIDISRNKASSETKIYLLEYKTFDDKINATDYIKIWSNHEQALKDLENTNNNEEIFVGVIKVESSGYISIGNIGASGDFAETFAILCINSSIMPESNKIS